MARVIAWNPIEWVQHSHGYNVPVRRGRDLTEIVRFWRSKYKPHQGYVEMERRRNRV